MNQKLQQFKEEIAGREVVVVGMGVSNIPLIKFLADCGAHVTACDKNESAESTGLPSSIKVVLGENYLTAVENKSHIFKTPGIRPDVPEFLRAAANGAVISSEMELFMRLCPAETIIGVTGSDGKTTTTTLIYEMLKARMEKAAEGLTEGLPTEGLPTAGPQCWVGGNIGTPLIGRLDEIKPHDIVVLELSSFQLMGMRQSPNIAVITNITPNHLDYHTSMEEYIDAKTNIFRYQRHNDKLVLNRDNEITRDLAGSAPGNVTFFSRNTPKILSPADIKIPGMHNFENYMAAIAAVEGLVDEDTIRHVARTFSGVAHRLEFVREVDGVKYYNDSIASTPTRTRACFGVFSGQKIILIAGGYDKKIPFDDFGKDIVESVKTLVLIGQTAPKILEAVENSLGEHDAISPEIINAGTLENAVTAAKNAATPGDIVVLSPACASFDQFKNFEVRGNLFKELVGKL